MPGVEWGARRSSSRAIQIQEFETRRERWRRHAKYEVLRPTPDRQPSSTVAITERVKNMAEYAAAKAAGETLCRHLSFFDDNLRIHIERLPRIATDQTTTLAGYPAQSAFDVMLEVMRSIQEREA